MDVGATGLSGDMSCIRDAVGYIKRHDENSVDLDRVNASISRLSVVIAKRQTSPEQNKAILADLRKISELVNFKTDNKSWRESENKRALPAALRQGIATCCNLINPQLPDEIHGYRAYHGDILRQAIASDEITIGASKSPQDCVRKYCFEILRSGCEVYEHYKLYLLRDPSSVVQEEYPSIVLSYTKSIPPASQEDIGHALLVRHPEKGWYNAKDGRVDTRYYPSLQAIIQAHAPNACALCAPSKKDLTDYINHYAQSKGYRFTDLELDESS